MDCLCRVSVTVLLLGGACAVSDCGRWAGKECVVSVVSGAAETLVLQTVGVSVVSGAAETLVLQAVGVSVVSAAAETLVLQAVGVSVVSAAAETLLQAVGLLLPLPWL